MKTIKVVAAVIKNEDRIFATARGYGDYKGWWEFPGGKVEEGETPEGILDHSILPLTDQYKLMKRWEKRNNYP